MGTWLWGKWKMDFIMTIVVMIHEVGALFWKVLFLFLFTIMSYLRFRVLLSSFPWSLGCNV